MKIVIAGAGAVGFHLAELLTKENQDITLIDTDREVLMQVARNLDVLTLEGDATLIQVLEKLEMNKTELFIAVTTSENSNLLAAILAKELGAKNTIARISNTENLENNYKDKFNQLGVDVLISTQKLAALEIERLLHRASFTDLFEFEDGKISVVGFILDQSSPLINKTISQIDASSKGFEFRGIALLRGHVTLIPNEDTILQKGDHLYISTQKESLEMVMKFVGMKLKPIKNVMIIGGTPVALMTAQQIENNYAVTIVIDDKDKGQEFIEKLNKSLVIQVNPNDIAALKEEGLEQMDAFISLTPNSESNIINSLMAEELGVYKTIALVENVNYIHISQNIGIDTIINIKLIAANNIFRFVRKGKVKAIASLHGVNAEIIEFVIHKKNSLLRKPIKNLHLPINSIIAGVVRGQDSIIPNGDFKFEINDKVIILALPDAIHRVEEIFK